MAAKPSHTLPPGIELSFRPPNRLILAKTGLLSSQAQKRFLVEQANLRLHLREATSKGTRCHSFGVPVYKHEENKASLSRPNAARDDPSEFFLVPESTVSLLQLLQQ